VISTCGPLLAMVGPLGAANNDFMALFREAAGVPLPDSPNGSNCQYWLI